MLPAAAAARLGRIEALQVVPAVRVPSVPAHGRRRSPLAVQRTSRAACVAEASSSGRCPMFATLRGSSPYRIHHGATAGSGQTVVGGRRARFRFHCVRNGGSAALGRGGATRTRGVVGVTAARGVGCILEEPRHSSTRGDGIVTLRSCFRSCGSTV